MKARGPVQRLTPRQRRHDAVAGVLRAGIPTSGHFELRIDARAIDPLVNDALRPVGKAVHRLADGASFVGVERKDEHRQAKCKQGSLEGKRKPVHSPQGGAKDVPVTTSPCGDLSAVSGRDSV